MSHSPNPQQAAADALSASPVPVRASVELAPLIEAIAARVAERVVARLESGREDSPWLDVTGACVYTGLGRDAIYKLTAAQAIPCRKKANGQGLRFHRDELEAWMNEQFPRLDRFA
jgi:excisionase family DNA binding protein